RIDPIDAVKGHAAFTGEDDEIAAGEPEGHCPAVAGSFPDPEETIVAERDRDDRRVEIVLIAILMKAHSGARIVEIDKAGLGFCRILRDLAPDREQPFRNLRPGPVCHRMVWLVAVAADLV